MIALTVIAKMEDQYIKEWIEYNLKLGFDRIFIYENDWTCKVRNHKITKIPWNGPYQQQNAFTHFIQNYSDKYQWVAFFDVDEYLVLKRHKTIQEFIADFENDNGIAINLQTFGANGQINRGEYPNSILKQFFKRSWEVSPYVKLIVKLPTKGHMIDPHQFGITMIDTNRNTVSGAWNVNGPTDTAVINHYARKCYEDWLIRCKRGFPFSKNRTAKPEDWEAIKYEDSEILDLTALHFMYGLHW
jgi:hypothetical protein